MICPICQAHISDRALKCPSCRSDIQHTRIMTRMQHRWCEVCGARLAEDALECSSCHAPVVSMYAQAPQSASSSFDMSQGVVIKNNTSESLLSSSLSERMPATHISSSYTASPSESEHISDAERTNQLIRIESAIPQTPSVVNDTTSHDRFPRIAMFLAAFVCAAIFTSATVLYITHPWDPDAFDIKAKVAHDTSKAGSPGVIKELSAQDKKSQKDLSVKGDDQTYDKLKSAYENLGKYMTRLSEEEVHLRDMLDASDTPNKDLATKINDETQRLAVGISNQLSDIESVNVESGTYKQDKEQLQKLGNWLRNYADILRDITARAKKSSHTNALKNEISKKLGASSKAQDQTGFKSLFNQYYDGWSVSYKEAKR